MCYRPLHIYNNSLSGTQYSNNKRTVPCGKCESCRNRYIDEWFVRSYYHYEYYTKVLRGCVSFITLTYSNAFLPKYKDGEFEIPCFDKWDIQRFIKYMRRYAVKKLHWSVVDANLITSLICSEYGSNTIRPHYHGLVYLPFQISSFVLLDMLRYAWSVSDNNRKCPTHIPIGWVSFGRVNGRINPFVQSLSALKYVVKYVAKDFASVDDVYGLRQYCSKSENYDKIKDYLPFHLQSRFYGLHGTRVISDCDVINNCIDDPLPPKGKFDHKLPIPQYLLRKIFYTRCKNRNNASIGIMQHSYRYYRLLPQLLAQRALSIYNKFRESVISFDAFKETYPLPSETTTNVYNLYKQVKSVLSDNYRISDYTYYTLLQQFQPANINVGPNTDLQRVLNVLTRKQALAHDKKVNTTDLTKLCVDVKKYVPSDYTFENRFVDPFYIPDVMEDMYDYDINLHPTAEHLLEIDTKIRRKVVAPCFCDTVSFEDRRKWDKFDRFYGFDMVSNILDKLKSDSSELKEAKQILDRQEKKLTTDINNDNSYTWLTA